MKTTTSFVTAMILGSSVAMASLPASAGWDSKGAYCDPKNKVERKLNRMSEKLNLNTEQRAEIRVILEQQQEQMAAIRADGKARMNAVLTDEQQAELADIKAHYRRHH